MEEFNLMLIISFYTSPVRYGLIKKLRYWKVCYLENRKGLRAACNLSK